MFPSSIRRLNIGCGGNYRHGYLNLDCHDSSVADVRAEAALLPFADEQFERVEMLHVIEHLPYVEALYAVAEVYRVLQPGGCLVIETPDPEKTFDLFLKDDSKQQRSQLLSWIFGLEAPGYPHRLLYPEQLLRHTLEQAGFRDLRRYTPQTHLYAPGLRMVATRGKSSAHGILAELRHWIRQSEEIELTHQLQALEFETVFVDHVLTLSGAGEAPSDPLRAALCNILMAPPAAKAWLALCERHGLELACDRHRLAKVAEAAVSERLELRMEALFEQLCEQGSSADDGYDYLCEKGLAALRSAYEGPIDNAREQLRALLPPPTGGSAPEEQRQPLSDGSKARRNKRRMILTRNAFKERVTRMHNRAVRYLCHGHVQTGIALLERAARARIDPFYSLWNLAVAYAAIEDFDRSIEIYQKALGLAASVTEPVLARELAVCYLHAGRPNDALSLVRERRQQMDRETPVIAAQPVKQPASERSARSHRGDAPTTVSVRQCWDSLEYIARQMISPNEKGFLPRLPALRVRPVLAGESLYHEPDPA
ncbi:MAG: methyltransferase domain-containing protein [Deltaproteobacteria bacterium]|nr:methyltransferase domain-containing protein [Deltaproteobacteria bacterium]